jgi:hypothetical protein
LDIGEPDVAASGFLCFSWKVASLALAIQPLSYVAFAIHDSPAELRSAGTESALVPAVRRPSPNAGGGAEFPKAPVVIKWICVAHNGLSVRLYVPVS